jgi:hypothetical protein
LTIRTLIYSFGIINWHQEEIQELERRTKKMINIHGQPHSRADTDCLQVPRKAEGKGSDGDRSSLHCISYEIMAFIDSKADSMIQIIRTNQHHTNSTIPYFK